MTEAEWIDIGILKKLTGESDEELLSCLLLMAEEKLLELTNRTRMTPKLANAKRNWALIAYNRLGMEGEAARSQGGISSSFVEIPQEIMGVIKATRIARVGGRVHEKAEDENQKKPAQTILPSEENGK